MELRRKIFLFDIYFCLVFSIFAPAFITVGLFCVGFTADFSVVFFVASMALSALVTYLRLEKIGKVHRRAMNMEETTNPEDVRDFIVAWTIQLIWPSGSVLLILVPIVFGTGPELMYSWRIINFGFNCLELLFPFLAHIHIDID